MRRRRVAPVIWSAAALSAAAIATSMPVTDGLPDPVAVFATSVFGWYPLPVATVLIGMWVLAGVGLLGALGALVWRAQAWAPAVGLIAQTCATLPVGLALPSLFWQVGASVTPRPTDVGADTDFAHIALALLVVALPLALRVVERWRSAYTYRGAADRGKHTFAVAARGPGRMFRALALSLPPAAARELGAQVAEQLRFHTAYLAVPTTYQFVMPNGALLTITDAAPAGRRTLVMGGRVPRGYRRVIGTEAWPRGVPDSGGWFGWDVPGEAGIDTLARWSRMAFANQDDERREDAVFLELGAPLAAIRR